MSILITITTVLFVLLCVLLVIIILLQSDKSAGMGILGGSSQSAFGSSTADVITRITTVMVAIFMIASLGLSIMESKRVGTFSDKILKKGDHPKGTIEQDPSQKSEEPAAGGLPEKTEQK
jgi:preprotein translocase subunit SecG